MYQSENSCVEMGDNVCTRAYMQFDLIYVYLHHMTDLKSIFSNVKNNSKYIDSVVFSLTLFFLHSPISS